VTTTPGVLTGRSVRFPTVPGGVLGDLDWPIHCSEGPRRRRRTDRPSDLHPVHNPDCRRSRTVICRGNGRATGSVATGLAAPTG